MKFAVILSGNGVYDGAEIHEVVMTLLAIDKAGCEYVAFAPNILQHHVINHLTGEEMKENRNVLVESARIMRGKVNDLKDYKITDFNALILPGGFGVAKNLSDYAFKGADMNVMPEVEKAIIDTWKAKKPVGALCIAPVVLSRLIGNKVNLTIGDDKNTAEDVTKLGAVHHNTRITEVITDKDNRIFTTPCYMLSARISEIAESADNLIKTMLENVNQN